MFQCFGGWEGLETDQRDCSESATGFPYLSLKDTWCCDYIVIKTNLQRCYDCSLGETKTCDNHLVD